MAVSPRSLGEREPRPARPAGDAKAHRRGTFDRIVVPVSSEDPLSLYGVEAAARVSSKRATVVLVCVLEVPRELPLDALFPEEEAAARELLRRAAAIVESYGVHALQRLERGYSAAPVVLELADEFAADLVVVAAPVRERRGRSAFGHMVTSVLHRATCRVMLVTRRRQARSG